MMRAIIKSFGFTLQQVYGITGVLIADLSREHIISQMRHAVARRMENPYHSITIIVQPDDLPSLKLIHEEQGTPEAVTVREPMSFEKFD